ncbi:MAG: amidohydrolase [Clostridia bacterium]|nr:amidohydrolase [Clostridia bacterium]
MFNIDNDYIVKIRREIHMYPETDFDLPKTVALVKRELDSFGIEHTEKYGKGSVVGYINPKKEGFTIGLRADMDALNIVEKNNVEYRSKIDGKMHACGHDAHTAVLLATAKALKEMENELKCRVKLLFQPSEEGMKSGAVMMIENGVLDDVDIILGLHVTNGLESGILGICVGEALASSRHFTIEIKGKSAHAASAYTGIDALAVAVRMYQAIQLVLTREISPFERYLCSIGKLEAGTAQNIVADHAVMKGTIRAFNVAVSTHIFERIQKIAKALSEETGAEISVEGPLKSVCVYNNPYLSQLLKESMIKLIGKENYRDTKPGMGSEDFSRLSDKVPGVFFRLGTKNEAKGCSSAAHHDDFSIDEEYLHRGAETFVQFIIDNQNGVDIQKAKASDDR